MAEVDDKPQVLSRQYLVTMQDGSKWSVPVWVIALSRALEYQDKHDSLADAFSETLEVFVDDELIEDWAQNNMDWDEVEPFSTKIRDATEAVDYQEGWVNGEHEVK